MLYMNLSEREHTTYCYFIQEKRPPYPIFENRGLRRWLGQISDMIFTFHGRKSNIYLNLSSNRLIWNEHGEKLLSIALFLHGYQLIPKQPLDGHLANSMVENHT